MTVEEFQNMRRGDIFAWWRTGNSLHGLIFTARKWHEDEQGRKVLSADGMDSCDPLHTPTCGFWADQAGCFVKKRPGSGSIFLICGPANEAHPMRGCCMGCGTRVQFPEVDWVATTAKVKAGKFASEEVDIWRDAVNAFLGRHIRECGVFPVWVPPDHALPESAAAGLSNAI